MATYYLPRTDSGILAWSSTFAAYISANEVQVGLTIEQAAAYDTAQTAYATAYAAVQDDVTRSPTNIVIKNERREALVTLTQQMVNIIQAYPGTTDDMRSAMGITIRDNTTTPKPVPATAPVIIIKEVDAWTVSLRLQDVNSTSRAKPKDVSGAAVFTYVGPTPPVDVADWKFEGNVTRTSTQVVFPSALEPGTTVWMTAMWFNPTAESGPAATPVSTKINWGGMNMPQAA